MSNEVNISASWKNVLHSEFKLPYFKQIVEHLKTEKKSKKIIYPNGSLIFNAFEQTPFEMVKVVIIGQDPYHQPKQAMGLSFSVPDNIKHPPSLQNIFKELNNDIGMNIPNSGNLTSWAKQGVLLLNSILTVRESEPGSHAQIGWQHFTNAVIKKLSENKKGIVFLLWGNYAKEKKVLINTNHHFILQAAHPSPFSAHQGFFGCKHFSKTNEILMQQGFEAINWSLN